MTRFKVDFSDVEVQSPIRPGKYDVVVASIEMKQSDSSEHPYLNWKCSIVEGEFEGRTIYMVTSLSPKALWKLQEVFTSYGLEGDAVELEVDEGTGMLTSPSLDGQPGVATVFNEPYRGRLTSKISDLVGPGAVAEEAVPVVAVPNTEPAKVNPFTKQSGQKRTFK